MAWASHRLRSGQEIAAVTRRGVRCTRSHIVVHAARFAEDSPVTPRAGFIVSKKVGNAVTRNTVTRRLREIIRPLLADMPPHTVIVLRALPGIDEEDFADLQRNTEAAVLSCVRKLELRSKA